MADDDEVNQDSDSTATSGDYEIVDDCEPKLSISGNGNLEQLKMSMSEILNDDTLSVPKSETVQKMIVSGDNEEKAMSISLTDIHIENKEPEISVITEMSRMPSLDSKLSIYTLSPSPTDEELMSISACLDYQDYVVFDGLMYYGSDIVRIPSAEVEIKNNMAILNAPSSPKKLLSVSLLINAEGRIILYEQSSCNEITSFDIQQIKNYIHGDPESSEASFLALVQDRHDCTSENVFISHHFKCESPEHASKIVNCLITSSKKEPRIPVTEPSLLPDTCENVSSEPVVENIHSFTFETNLEFKEDDGKGGFTSCPRGKDYFKLRCNLKKTVIVHVKQISDSTELHIERCFGFLISPGRNVRNSDMQLIEMVSFVQSNFAEKVSYCVTGLWDPNGTSFEVLNTETPKNTRVYLTVALYLVISGIQDPVRFIIETKAQLLPQHERFWYKTKKSLQEHFYLNLREVTVNGEQLFKVLNLDSASRIQRKKEKLRLDLNKANLPKSTPSDPESESDNDEPLLSGTGNVRKDCTETELEGWHEVLLKWRQDLNLRPRHLNALVKRGIPEALRGEVWQLLAGCHDHREFVDTYKSLLNKECPCESIIQRDVNRTFPAHHLFKDKGGIGQESLFRICKAYSVYDLEVEYCQGLSFLIAALLLHMPEEQAFGVLAKIMYNYRIRDMFRNSFQELHLKFFQLQRLIEDQIPELFSHFQDLGIEVHMFASQWFLTLFTAKFPLTVVYFIIDVFLLDSFNVIFQVAVALLMLSKKELLALDFEGILKHFRVSLPKKYRTEEAAQLLIQTAVKVKVKKLEKYEKEYIIQKEQEKLTDDPLLNLQKDNKRLLESNLHLDQENDDLAFELINSKLQLKDDLSRAEEKAEAFAKELLTLQASFSEVEEVKKRLEVEVAQLKEMCRRELQRAETENVQNASIISGYKQICNQLSSRLEKEQNNAKRNLEVFKAKVISCSDCSKFADNLQSESSKSTGDDLLKSDQILTVNETNSQANELELELAQTKLALVEAECKNQDLNHQLNMAISELQSSKNTWFQKTLSTIRDAGMKKDLPSN